MMDYVSFIMAYEDGKIDSQEEYIDGFANLIRTGLINNLQSSYQRTAVSLINAGYIDTDGNVLNYPEVS